MRSLEEWQGMRSFPSDKQGKGMLTLKILGWRPSLVGLEAIGGHRY